MSTEPQVYVEIYHKKTGDVAKRMGPMSEHKAGRVEAGACINLGRDWATRQVGA